MKLVPLSPYKYEFSGQAGKVRNNYFFIPAKRGRGTDFREALRVMVEATKGQGASGYDLYSIYVYENTDKINEHFAGNAHDLRGVYDNWLISYARWNKDELDVFYIIESGNVVFDMVGNEPVSPGWEFD